MITMVVDHLSMSSWRKTTCLVPNQTSEVLPSLALPHILNLSFPTPFSLTGYPKLGINPTDSGHLGLMKNADTD